MDNHADRVYESIKEQITRTLYDDFRMANSDPGAIEAAKRKYKLHLKKAAEVYEFLKHQGDKGDDPG